MRNGSTLGLAVLLMAQASSTPGQVCELLVPEGTSASHQIESATLVVVVDGMIKSRSGAT